MRSFTALLLAVPLARATYILTDNFVGKDFFFAFDWENIDDPTHGRVYAPLLHVL
jgi:hypothetical protein